MSRPSRLPLAGSESTLFVCGGFSPGVSEALRNGIAARLRSPSGPSPELRGALRMVDSEARIRGLRPEQLKAMFTETWESLPEVQALPAGPERNDVLAEVITFCLAAHHERG